MRTFGAPLGRYLPALPDGEVGERRSWVNRFGYLLFNGHDDLETLRRPPKIDGVEQLLPTKRAEGWQFRVRPGVKQVRFGLPGLRLGYARDATSSYFVFRTLREQGLLPADLRFQVSIPMINSVVRPLYFPEPGDIDKVRPGFEEALAAEIELIVRRIPASDLAIQWDLAGELLAVYGQPGNPPSEASIETHVAPVPAIVGFAAERSGPRLSFLFRNLRRLARLRAGGFGTCCRSHQRGRCCRRPTNRLDSCSCARPCGRRILCAPRPPRTWRCARLSRDDPQHAQLPRTAGRGAQIRTGLRFGRLLRLRPHAPRTAATTAGGSSQGCRTPQRRIEGAFAHDRD